ncbi:GNAT family N-acetyltransferase [Pseudonocardia humida]|uniref:GNAT family N-acetyltransferase n=1 Tax=Pseudonocardia humida TaxID=2800819 RepID=A0ABT1ACV9_9PSEU|nr:GNAT family N-acetyltransferase [Pseudonocardia humida]MCO1660877.1 GNAT family N-acetyltransferase [Pseudonocardia humida]
MTTAQRLAVPADIPRIAALMRTSVRTLFPRSYSADQTASAARYLTEPDPALIEDGTYFVHEADGEIVACGGWSRRGRLHAGTGAGADDDRLLDPATEPARVRAMFVRGDWTRRGLGRAVLAASEQAARRRGFAALTLMATLPGVPLYAAYGFAEVERVAVALPDGVVLDCAEMAMPLRPSRPGDPIGLV